MIGYPIIYERVRGRPWPFGTFVPYGASSLSLYSEPSSTTTTTTTILPSIVRTTPLERHESSMMMIGRQLPAFVPYPQMASWHNSNHNHNTAILLPPQCHYPLPIMTTTTATSTISYTGSSDDIGPILRRRPSYKCHRYKSRRYHSTTMPVSAST